MFLPMDYKAEKITPYGSSESKTEQVREMFDSIAPAYDFMNRAMTFGIDKIWRRKAVAKLKKYGVKSILDVATGTGDLALLLYRKLQPKRISGIDLSAIRPQILVSEGATVTPASGEVQNFTGAVEYTVVSESGENTQVYTVTVTH